MPMAKRLYKKAQRYLRYAGIRLMMNRRARQRAATSTSHGEESVQDRLNKIDFSNARVLFLRQNAIGDALISTPIFEALKTRYPGITIDVLLNRRNRSIYDNDANIRRIYLIKMRPFDLIPNLRLIRRERYDILIDLVHSPSTTSALICLLGRAAVTVGGIREHPSRYPPETEAVYDIKVAATPPATRDRMLLRLAECLRVFGIDPDAGVLKPIYTPGDRAQSFAEALLVQARNSSRDGTAANRVVGINISGAKAYKYWGTENYIALLRRLMPQHPDTVFLIIYSSDYAGEAGEISQQTGATLTGGTPTLDSFAALIARLDALITTDSSAVHFADAARVPTVTLMIDPEGHELWCPSISRYRVVHAEQRQLSTVRSDTVADAFNDLIDEVDELAAATRLKPDRLGGGVSMTRSPITRETAHRVDLQG